MYHIRTHCGKKTQEALAIQSKLGSERPLQISLCMQGVEDLLGAVKDRGLNSILRHLMSVGLFSLVLYSYQNFTIGI